MEHHNPLLTNLKSDHKFITIGEIMLRLTPPNYQKIRMANEFEATYGGSEANIALALANLGIDSTFFTVVPNNSIGKSAIRMLRSNDVHCTPVILSTPEETPTHRLGTYYLETGYGIRASKVTYDRKHSAITEYDLSKVDIHALLEGFTWLHVSGITPALNKTCADFILNCLKVAKEMGLTTCGRMKTTTPRATGRTVFPCSPATSSRTRYSSTSSSGIPTSSASPAMCAMPTPVPPTL